MAPIQKRARRELDDDNHDEFIEDDGASRHQENIQRKKARLSKGRDHANGNESSAESERRDTPPPDSHALPQSTQYEIDRDAGFKHLENESDDDLQAAEVIESRKEFIGDNRPAESGIIELINCVNFMCHERLTVNLGPLINFVVGKNGSGKSALVAALQICLGVKASSTNRGTNLKGMIMAGRKVAMVQVQIANRGADAYLHDQYGDSITVERGFNIQGGSSFKLKSKTGRTISTRRRDLDDLIEHYQFQVDNPMNILTQDNAKQFITKSGPEDKYRFFIKGTQLEQLDTDYIMIHENVENIQQKVYQQNDNVKVLLKKRVEAYEKVKLVERHATERENYKKWRDISAWAQVEEQEYKLEARSKVIEESQKAIKAAEANVQAKDQEYAEADARLNRVLENVQKFVDDKAPLEEAVNDAKQEWDDSRKAMVQMKHEQIAIREEVKLEQSKVDTFKRQLKDEEERLAALSGGSHSRKLAEIEDAKARLSEAEQAYDQARVENPRLEERRVAAETAYDACNRPVPLKKEELAKAEKQLQDLNNNRGTEMNGYDRNMPRLLNRIRNDSGFRSTPVGPVGLHCKLLKPVWSDVLESSLSRLLEAFVVTNSQDQQRLSRLAGECGVRITVYIVPANLGNLKEPDEQFDTILRVLDVDNVLVKNAMILNARVEQILLIKDERDAQRVLYDGSPPKYGNICYAIDPFKRGWGVKFTAGNDTRGPIRGPNNPPRMKTDIAARISRQQELVNELRRELKELELKSRDALLKQNECDKALKRGKREESTLKLAQQRAEERLEHLQQELENDKPEDGLLESLKQNLDEAEEKLRSQQRSYEDSQEQLTDQNNRCTDFKARYDEAKIIVTSYEAQLGKARERQRRFSSNRQLSLVQKNDAYEKVITAKSEEQIAIDKHAEQAAQVASFIEQASTKICSRVPVPPGETVASIDAKIDKFRKQLELYQKRQGGTDEQIEAAAVAAHEAWENADSNLERIDDYCSLLKGSLKDRQDKWRKFQRHISAHSRMNFKYLLSERNFRGSIAFDHKTKQLEVKVEPDVTRSSDEGRKTKTLSGGEKSFSSICLLLALWEAMGAPLRILDEYDVFMDDVNREVSTRMIISAARRAVGKQFILITPHPIAKEIEQANQDVVFFSMPDPRKRGQRTIEESMGV